MILKSILFLRFICTHKQDRPGVVFLVISQIVVTVKSPTIFAILISTPCSMQVGTIAE